jgi:site-specific DNA-methyltransferase (adenine-specific)
VHPTQKPIPLYDWILQNYAKEGDLILDTHLGSGSIAIACGEMGYSLDACELDGDYFKDSVARVQRHFTQSNAFMKTPEILVNPKYESRRQSPVQ